MNITPELTTDYKFIIGNFYGCINCKNMNEINIPDIDDYEKLKKAVDSALKQLNEMRSIEGKQIYKDLMSRIRIIKTNTRN